MFRSIRVRQDESLSEETQGFSCVVITLNCFSDPWRVVVEWADAAADGGDVRRSVLPSDVGEMGRRDQPVYTQPTGWGLVSFYPPVLVFCSGLISLIFESDLLFCCIVTLFVFSSDKMSKHQIAPCNFDVRVNYSMRLVNFLKMNAIHSDFNISLLRWTCFQFLN